MSETLAPESANFIYRLIDEELAQDKHAGRVVTRFPPEPNGYLHIGHAKSICLNFGIARDYDGGVCNLRFDDTNPAKEEQEYVDSIMEDVSWLGFSWGDKVFFASDYFEDLYGYAVKLIEAGKAYVDDQSAEEIRENRGTLTAPGKESPYRSRTVEENLALFKGMRDGDFPDGSKVLRARIDMASGNLNLRDPVMYRVLHAHHHRTGDKWCIYPMYDWAHGQSDALEGITNSLCTLEFEDHRPLYQWFVDQLEFNDPPLQTEFARLNLSHTVLSKRKLIELVKDGHVQGWDDPRMPTIAGLRRRGFTSKSITDFCDRIGVAKKASVVDVALLEHCVREDLNPSALRRMAVLDPLKVVITNYPEGQTEELDAKNNPNDEGAGSRKVPFGREFYIERTDFMEDAPRKFFRLSVGREVRLRYAYFVTCTDVVKDDAGNVTELHCTYDPETKGGNAPDGRKVKGTIHWVSAAHGKKATIRLFDRLFTVENPGADKDGNFLDLINPDSLETIENAIVEPALAELEPEARVQFERTGYFVADRREYTADNPVFNRIVSLRDTWAKKAGK
jgi:glutaminyl-tRNA synthetase